MTKEEILEKWYQEYRNSTTLDRYHADLNAMQEYADQQTTSLKAEVESLQSQLAETQHKLDISEKKVKLNYDSVINLEKQLAKAEAEKNGNIEIFKAFLDGLSNIIDNDSYEKILDTINKHGNNK
jgi:septal ring factor EnvC (AmiA/AmiB activator)